MVEFGCVGAEQKVGDSLVCGVVYHRKMRPTQLLIELSWVWQLLKCETTRYKVVHKSPTFISRRMQLSQTLYTDYFIGMDDV